MNVTWTSIFKLSVSGEVSTLVESSFQANSLRQTSSPSVNEQLEENSENQSTTIVFDPVEFEFKKQGKEYYSIFLNKIFIWK